MTLTDTRPREYSPGGKLIYMPHAKGHVMVRRPGCAPFVLSEKEWLALRLWKTAGRAALEQEGSRTNER